MASTVQQSSYLQPGASSWRFRSSATSSTSSLGSTLSDFTSSTSVSSSPPAPKTNAFFASPFSTRSPSPDLPTPPPAPKQQPTRSLTADFFSTPTRSPSPPVEPQSTKLVKNFHFASRMFPSRYTSTARRAPTIDFVDIEDPEASHERAQSPAGSDLSVTSPIEGKRLPTPPPPVSPTHSIHRERTLGPLTPRLDEQPIDQTTPRPPDAEPTLHFERSLLFTKNKSQLEPDLKVDEEKEIVPDILESGSLISIPSFDLTASRLSSPLTTTISITPPQSARSSQFGGQKADVFHDTRPFPESRSNDPASISTSTSTTPNQIGDGGPPTSSNTNPTIGSTLRLVRGLGHGAFSSVWLAEDLSHIPLTLVSKKSVRDLRRRASGRDSHQEHAKERSGDGVMPVAHAGGDLDVPEPKRNRFRDGFKNMLMFSKVASSSPTNLTSSLPASPTTPVTPSRHHDALDTEVGPISRHPSYRSNDSAMSGGHGGHLVNYPGSGPTGLTSPSGVPQLRLHVDDRLASLSRDSSMKKFRERVRGTRPGYLLGRAYLDERHGGMGEPMTRALDDFGLLQPPAGGYASSNGSLYEADGIVASLSRRSSLNRKAKSAGDGRLVAVKLTPRRPASLLNKRSAKEEEERTRVGFVREVEVLKHISHPNITPLLAHLSTPSHHILVLPYLPGGDLLGLVNNDVSWSKLCESVLRRIWCELCKAVGWMHGVGLVHRDIKLENILLTTEIFSSLESSSPPPDLSSLPALQAPLIKLSDFGLSRFVEIDANGDAELLTTRCGSEAYAAPELVTGGKAGYDARKTDAWACGVVLYALVVRKLPFGEGTSELNDGKIGGERGGRTSVSERRQWLMKIATGDWAWPIEEGANADVAMSSEDGEDELVGPTLVRSNGAKRVVERLLVRDPKKRARIINLWQDVWMCGGEDELWWRERERQRVLEEEIYRRLMSQVQIPSVGHDFAYGHEAEDGPTTWLRDQNAQGGGERDCSLGIDHHSVDEEEEEDQGGCLLDEGSIDEITRQEVV